MLLHDGHAWWPHEIAGPGASVPTCGLTLYVLGLSLLSTDVQ